MRISDWSSDVCSSDLADAIALHHAVRKPAMIEKRHPAFEQKALRGELQNLVVDGEIAAFERHVRAAEFGGFAQRSEEHTSELQSLMRTSYAVFCLKKKIYYYFTTSLQQFTNIHIYSILYS